MKTGVGNGHDLVGRFFADHPIPGDTATMVVFNGNIAPYYQRPYKPARGISARHFAPRRFKRGMPCCARSPRSKAKFSSTAVGQAAVATTAARSASMRATCAPSRSAAAWSSRPIPTGADAHR
jgi:hypothetical protein